MAANLGELGRAVRRGESKKVVNPDGWSAELLEDAYSVLCLGPAMFVTLRRVLRQHYQDCSEPWVMIVIPRRSCAATVAGAILIQMGFKRGWQDRTKGQCERKADLQSYRRSRPCG